MHDGDQTWKTEYEYDSSCLSSLHVRGDRHWGKMRNPALSQKYSHLNIDPVEGNGLQPIQTVISLL